MSTTQLPTTYGERDKIRVEVMTWFQAVRKPGKARCADRHLDIIERDCEQEEQ
jgi:hypothetical protein